jgi:hypothetical protein
LVRLAPLAVLTSGDLLALSVDLLADLLVEFFGDLLADFGGLPLLTGVFKGGAVVGVVEVLSFTVIRVAAVEDCCCCGDSDLGRPVVILPSWKRSNTEKL